MKYSIFTVANEDYSPFLRLFVHSILDTVPLYKIESIVVADTGLSEDTLKFLSNFPEVQILDTGMKTKHARVHDDDWEKNVYSKARLLLESIQQSDTFVPTVMIDCDCIIVKDFTILLEQMPRDCDVLPCLRDRAGRQSNPLVVDSSTSSHIGSFFVAQTKNSIPFIKG